MQWTVKQRGQELYSRRKEYALPQGLPRISLVMYFQAVIKTKSGLTVSAIPPFPDNLSLFKMNQIVLGLVVMEGTSQAHDPLCICQGQFTPGQALVRCVDSTSRGASLVSFYS